MYVIFRNTSISMSFYNIYETLTSVRNVAKIDFAERRQMQYLECISACALQRYIIVIQFFWGNFLVDLHKSMRKFNTYSFSISKIVLLFWQKIQIDPGCILCNFLTCVLWGLITNIILNFSLLDIVLHKYM